MSRSTVLTHAIYLMAIAAIIFMLRGDILSRYIQGRLSSSGKVDVLETVVLYDKGGKKVGELYPGIELMPPDIGDLDDTDLSDNQRFKLLIDLAEVDYNRLKERSYSVYSGRGK
ncbi:MAG: hypothetical protein BGO12_00465 [Verrucomicrobia bacterium 61-8]|nr:hypothetical protein [Verrucomicrobiota bacterium]OJV04255.1 MAG: hypothetical protein BGO12_00465 [Verrucomicrobia bacterium 61-8]